MPPASGLLLFPCGGGTPVMQEAVQVEELYPSASELFQVPAARLAPPVLPLFAWVVAGALAALLGRQLLYWADHNI